MDDPPLTVTPAAGEVISTSAHAKGAMLAKRASSRMSIVVESVQAKVVRDRSRQNERSFTRFGLSQTMKLMSSAMMDKYLPYNLKVSLLTGAWGGAYSRLIRARLFSIYNGFLYQTQLSERTPLLFLLRVPVNVHGLRRRSKYTRDLTMYRLF